jgi:hypothetical protein
MAAITTSSQKPHVGDEPQFPIPGAFSWTHKPFAVVDAKIKTTDLFHKRAPLELIGLFLIALTGIGMAWLSRQKRCCPVIDFDRELYIPRAVCPRKIYSPKSL